MNINRRHAFKVLLGIAAAAALTLLPKATPPSTTAMDDLNIHRLLTQIQDQMSIALESHIGDFNDEVTRKQLQDTIQHQLDYMKHRQVIQDFTVICDEQNNPPSAIDKNQLRVDLIIRPAKTVDYINLNFTMTPGEIIMEHL
jgi:hypothetical protein